MWWVSGNFRFFHSPRSLAFCVRSARSYSLPLSQRQSFVPQYRISPAHWESQVRSCQAKSGQVTRDGPSYQLQYHHIYQLSGC